MTTKEIRKAIVGRKIVGFEANAFRDGVSMKSRNIRAGEFGMYPETPDCGRFTYDPVLILDDGTRLRFVVHETEHGDYGIDPIVKRRT